MNNDTFLEPSFTAYDMAQQKQEEKQLASPKVPKQPTATQNKQDFEPLPFGYSYTFYDKGTEKKGIYKEIPAKSEADNPTKIRIGDLLFFMGFACEENRNNWGFFCRWKDPNSNEHKEVIPFEKITSINGDWFSILANGGYRGNRKELANIFLQIETKKRFVLVDKIGWKDNSYILPHKTFSEKPAGKELVLNCNSTQGLYIEGGKPEKWQEVKSLIQGNTRLEFACLVSFAGVLLDLANFESGGFTFEGASSCGKTTALQVASAVWGSREHIKQWRATANGLEGLAVLHNDNVLILDELGQASAKEVDNAIYMLANGQGKSRANKNGDSRQAKKWRLLFLSSGEIGISQKLAEDGKKAKAGQEVRFISIPVSKEHICELHGLEKPQDIIDKIQQLTAENYGFDGVKFIENVCRNYNEIKNAINSRIQQYTKLLYSTGTNTQIERVAKRFALIEYARDLLIYFKIINKDFAAGTVQACFKDWLAGKDNTDSYEEQQIINAIVSFVERYPNRFQDVNGTATYINDRAGYKKIDKDTIYYFSSNFFRDEVLKGYNINNACKILERKGWLVKGGDRYTTKISFENSERRSYYAITIKETD